MVVKVEVIDWLLEVVLVWVFDEWCLFFKGLVIDGVEDFVECEWDCECSEFGEELGEGWE